MTVLLEQRPRAVDAATLLALRDNPPRAGAWAMQRRRELFGRETLLRPTHEGPPVAGPSLLRRGELVALREWPAASSWQASDRVAIPLDPGDAAAARSYVEWLLELAADHGDHSDDEATAPRSLAPYSPAPAGTLRLWAIAVARLALPAAIRVEARHDLIGIRLAHVALGFGADTLAGPIEADRKLPLAGITRPNEATWAGLRNLIEQAGLECTACEERPRAAS